MFLALHRRRSVTCDSANVAHEGCCDCSAGSSSRDIGPQVPGAKVVAGLRPVEAPKSGTKWHKGFADTEAKQWFEAVTDEGHTYFWHVESHESRWEPPPEGYLSIQEQEEINRRSVKKNILAALLAHIARVLSSSFTSATGTRRRRQRSWSRSTSLKQFMAAIRTRAKLSWKPWQRRRSPTAHSSDISLTASGKQWRRRRRRRRRRDRTRSHRHRTRSRRKHRVKLPSSFGRDPHLQWRLHQHQGGLSLRRES